MPGLARMVHSIVLASLLSAAGAHGATVADPAAASGVNSAPCQAAAASSDTARAIASCGDVIADEHASRADRLMALTARAGANAREDRLDRALDDYDTALRLDPKSADLLNARGEVWRRKGNRPKAMRDFDAALRLDSSHSAARANFKLLASELERLGAVMAIDAKPSFNCARTSRPLERTICDNSDLATLDRAINALQARAVRDAGQRDTPAAQNLRREQEEFAARRDSNFGSPGYDLQRALSERVDQLMAIGRH